MPSLLKWLTFLANAFTGKTKTTDENTEKNAENTETNAESTEINARKRKSNSAGNSSFNYFIGKCYEVWTTKLLRNNWLRIKIES